MSSKTVSVVILVDGETSFLRRYIDSVICQSYGDLQVVLASKDPSNCPSYAFDEYTAKDSRIVVVKGEDSSHRSARNAALDVVTGDYILFVDDNDCLSTDAVSSAVKDLEDNDADMTVFDCGYINDKGYRLLQAKKIIRGGDATADSASFWGLYLSEQNPAFYSSNKLYKREVLNGIGFPCGRAFEDEFVLHLVVDKATRISFLKKTLCYRLLPSGDSQGGLDRKSSMDYCRAQAERLNYFVSSKSPYCDAVFSFLKSYLSIYYHGKLATSQKKDLRFIKETLRMAYGCKTVSPSKKNLLFAKSPFLYYTCRRLATRFSSTKKSSVKESPQYKSFTSDKGPRVVLLDTPTHGNLGDQAISLAEMGFVKRYAADRTLYEFTHYECRDCIAVIRTALHKDDILLVQGGGFIGSLWPNEHRVFIKILKQLKDFNVVVMPQTIYFSPSEEGLKRSFIRLLNESKNLTLCVRERRSLDFLKDNNVQCPYLFVPDIVLSLKPLENKEKNGRILLCFRKDLEKVGEVSLLYDAVENIGLSCDVTDTVIPSTVAAEERESIVKGKIDEFSRYSLVICDRLHAMIFAVLAKTPCIAFDNVSKKVSGVYEWLKDLNYIKCIRPEEISPELIRDTLSIKPSFDEGAFMKNYAPLIDLLKNGDK
jgi:exopolysaccharide biosynthesis predicted pyruvyltransferase EpsI/glycosyltransferase involved in cell wall biosynthesis